MKDRDDWIRHLEKYIPEAELEVYKCRVVVIDKFNNDSNIIIYFDVDGKFIRMGQEDY